MSEFVVFFVEIPIIGLTNPLISYHCCYTTGGKYSVLEGGLMVRNVTHLDSGKYTCRAFETTNKSSVSGITVIELKVRREYTFNSILNNIKRA